jgi:hypothetical protein
MSTNTRHGYLVIADISGYTSFVARTELEHSQEILTELLELLMARFQPLMTISKLEGGAVFKPLTPSKRYIQSGIYLVYGYKFRPA